MSYEEDAQELMKKFKLQFSQMQNQPQDHNIDLSKMYDKESEKSQTKEVNKDDISNIVQSFSQPIDQSPDQSPPGQSIHNVVNNLIDPQSTDQSPPDQNISMMNNIQTESQPVVQPVVQPPPSGGVPGGDNICSQCNTMHPPLKPGEKCPNAPQDVSKYGLDETSINRFVVDIRNIVVSQLNKKKIENGSKLFQFTIIELMKILEGYNE